MSRSLKLRGDCARPDSGHRADRPLLKILVEQGAARRNLGQLPV
jgi:hypothetical protein